MARKSPAVSTSRGRRSSRHDEDDGNVFNNDEDVFAKERSMVQLSGSRGSDAGKGPSQQLKLESVRARRQNPEEKNIRNKFARKRAEKKRKEKDRIFDDDDDDDDDRLQYQDEPFLDEDEDDDEDEEVEEYDDSEEDTSVWGKSRASYYGTDVLHHDRRRKGGDDEEEKPALLEEEEARRLRKQATLAMRLEDFAEAPHGEQRRQQEASSDEDEVEDGDDAKQRKEGKEQRVAKDITRLSEAQKLKILKNDAPELLQLIDEFRNGTNSLQQAIGPLLEKVRAVDDPDVQTSQGLSFLEAKFHMLLSYCTNLSFYFLLKASGKSPKDHPVIDQLVRLRLLMEKVRPLDQKLKYQIDKLVRMAATGPLPVRAGQQDPLSFRAKLDDLDDFDDDDDDGDHDDGDHDDDDKRSGKKLSQRRDDDDDDEELYRPPRVAEMAFDGDVKKKKKREERQLAKMSRSSMMKFLQEEYGEEPLEYDTGSVGSRSKATPEPGDDDSEQERTQFEEEYMMRLPVTRKQKQKQKVKHRAIATNANELSQLDDFGDIAGLSKQAADSKPLGHYLNEIGSARSRRDVSADADLPVKSPKAKHGGDRDQKRSFRSSGGGDRDQKRSFRSPGGGDRDQKRPFRSPGGGGRGGGNNKPFRQSKAPRRS